MGAGTQWRLVGRGTCPSGFLLQSEARSVEECMGICATYVRAEKKTVEDCVNVHGDSCPPAENFFGTHSCNYVVFNGYWCMGYSECELGNLRTEADRQLYELWALERVN